MSHSHTCHHQPLQVDTQQSEPVDWLNHPAGSSCSPWRTIITGNKCDKGSTSGLFPHRLINQSHVQQRTNTQQYYRIIVWLLYLWSTVCCTTFYVFVFFCFCWTEARTSQVIPTPSDNNSHRINTTYVMCDIQNVRVYGAALFAVTHLYSSRHLWLKRPLTQQTGETEVINNGGIILIWYNSFNVMWPNDSKLLLNEKRLFLFDSSSSILYNIYIYHCYYSVVQTGCRKLNNMFSQFWQSQLNSKYS